MKDYRRRRATRQDTMRAGIGALGVAMLAFVAFFAIKGAWGMYEKFAAASDADAASKVELATLKEQYAQVGESAAALSSARGVEAGVRERFGVALPGEGQIDIIRREASSTPQAPREQNLFQKILHALFVW